jgi:hypothetical protein
MRTRAEGEDGLGVRFGSWVQDLRISQVTALLSAVVIVVTGLRFRLWGSVVTGLRFNRSRV